MLWNFFKRKPKFAMPAYIECSQCKKHSEIDGNGGQMLCPHCGSTRMGRLEIGTGGKPSWFNESSAAIAVAKGE